MECPINKSEARETDRDHLDKSRLSEIV